jgi:hypothetical protein
MPHGVVALLCVLAVTVTVDYAGAADIRPIAGFGVVPMGTNLGLQWKTSVETKIQEVSAGWSVREC